MQYFASKFFEINILATLANRINILQTQGGEGVGVIPPIIAHPPSQEGLRQTSC